MYKPKDILNKYWGFDTFRNPQEEIILSVLEGNDTLALLPTGGGKSICFQIPTLLKEGICIVISPLIALMNDQVKNLQEKNIKALALTSAMSQDDIIRGFDNLQYGNYKFLYLSPEKLQSDFIQQKIRQLNVQLIAVDEAHCISEWGHDFRPAYLQIKILRDFFADTPIIALTASATKQVQEDICEQLSLHDPSIFKKSYQRENLAYQLYDVDDKLSKVIQILNKVKGSKIIYTNSRRSTVEFSNQLNSLGHKTCFYHGGMKANEKLQSYEKWLTDECLTIVATNAFGMGIDKSNVRAVIHINLPQSIENYMQEAGRGGRDEKKSFAVLLKNNFEVSNAQQQLKKSLPTIDFIKQVYFNLNQHFQIAYGEIIQSNHSFNLTEFSIKYKLPVALTFNAIKELSNEDIILVDDTINKKPTVHFLVSNKDVFNYFENQDTSKEKLIKLLLRTYGGIFESPKNINKKYLSINLSLSLKELNHQLEQLHNDNVIEFKDIDGSLQLHFLVAREDNKTINVVAKNILKRQEQKVLKQSQLLSFVEDNSICRSKQLLTYFGETQISDCGICDVCLQKKGNTEKSSLEDLAIKIVTLLKKKNALSSKDIVFELESNENETLICLQILLEKNRITVTSQNKYRLK